MQSNVMPRACEGCVFAVIVNPVVTVLLKYGNKGNRGEGGHAVY